VDQFDGDHLENMIGGTEDIDRFRLGERSTGRIYFWGDTFDMGAIVQEVNVCYLLPRRSPPRHVGRSDSFNSDGNGQEQPPSCG
jgi:hypothetical protein